MMIKKFFLLLLLPMLWSGCAPKHKLEQQPPEVIVASPTEEMVTNYEDTTGTVAATQQINVVARVEGFLESINFNDGQRVKKGDLLFVIEQESYLQKVKRSQALLDYDNAQYQRQLAMLKENATSQANVEEYLAKVQADRADLELAKINLSYTEVRAPFDGLLGAHQIDVGGYVGSNPANPTVLVTLEAITPVYVNFNINMRDALQLREELRALGQGNKEIVGTLPIFVALANEEGFPHEGILDFLNNSLDSSTGTIQARAIFPNEDLALIPGFFVTVRAAIGPPFLALTIPSAVIQSDQGGEFVLTVNEHQEVEEHYVLLGPKKGTSRALLKGIGKKDHVIISGLTRVKVGMKVRTEETPPKTLFNPTLK